MHLSGGLAQPGQVTSGAASVRATSAKTTSLRSLQMQRINMELLLETTPKESRYSNTLVDLMKREEMALRDISSGKQVQVRDLVARVDDLLFQETRAFFQKNAQHNSKRWRALAEKLEGERGRHRGGELMVKASGKIDLDLETMRLEEDYNRNWSLYEEFHLREAFKSQSSKVDSEWAGHEADLLVDYCHRRSSITGESAESIRQSRSNQSSEQDSSSPMRWQHAEKQKTLVHTAPVLSPVRKDIVSSTSKRKETKESKAELDRLEQQFKSAGESLESQKFSAKRWMAKQEIRLLAQAGEVGKERAVIADLIAKEIQEYTALAR
jgi:hypothetical protein